MKFDRKYLKEAPEYKYKILKKLFSINGLTRRMVFRYIDRFEGGQFYSNSIRRIFREVYDIDVGIGSYGCFTTNFRPHIKIGSYCSVAPGVQRLVGNHPYHNISTHPLFYKKEFGALNETLYNEQHLLIGNDVWIGVNAIITGNVHYIGDGAIIGAGAVVTHDVPPYTIVAGVPAKQISERFPKDVQERLLKSKWWDLYPDELSMLAEYAHDVDTFIEKIKDVKHIS